jgi:hypothetical protein
MEHLTVKTPFVIWQEVQSVRSTKIAKVAEKMKPLLDSKVE